LFFQAILLTENHHLIEFPSLLLPEGVENGSVINFHAVRNYSEESRVEREFWQLQDTILKEFGSFIPKSPLIKATRVKHTEISIEWEPLDLGRIEFHGIDVYKNVNRMFNKIPPDSTCVKFTGLLTDQEYEFQIVFKTSAGELTSNRVKVRTLGLDNFSCLRVAFGVFDRVWLVEELKQVILRLGASVAEEVDLETTHLVCESLAGPMYKAALQANIPVVAPEWIDTCVKEKKVAPCGPYYVKRKDNY
jgi:hypothetical protein